MPKRPNFTLERYTPDTVIADISPDDEEIACKELSSCDYRCIGGATLEAAEPAFKRTIGDVMIQVCEDLVSFQPEINDNGVSNKLKHNYVEDPVIGPHPYLLGYLSMWIPKSEGV